MPSRYPEVTCTLRKRGISERSEFAVLSNCAGIGTSLFSVSCNDGDKDGEVGAEPKMSSWSSEVVMGSGEGDMSGWESALPGTSRSISCFKNLA